MIEFTLRGLLGKEMSGSDALLSSLSIEIYDKRILFHSLL